jgi:hypothetical protein
MKRRLTILALTALAVVTLISFVSTVTSPAHAGGATQISGIAYFAEGGECTDPEGDGADFANLMTDDLEGCLYVFVESVEVSPSGTVRERGHETFVGSYKNKSGTFKTTYLFTAKFTGVPYESPQKFGRCQHPIVADSGTGVFDGVTGRLDLRDNIDEEGNAVNFPYRGHLRW